MSEEKKVTAADLIFDFNLYFEDLKYGIRTKLDKDTHDELEEWANKLTSGNMSGIARICIKLGLNQLEEERSDVAPSLSAAVKGRRKWLSKRNADIRLQRAAVELQQRYEPEYDAAMEKYAKDEGLKWPPDNIDPSVVDPVLKRIVSRLRTVLEEQDSTSLREVYKGMSNMDADKARAALLKLEEMGTVEIAGSRGEHGRMEISWRNNVPISD